ncbi:hypothetical protein [Rheinheimera soli]|uniref:hypothetical protein n=1 Tax=Rheinheimera soli TaxID=443616 RepID=UPI001E2BD436|nr:hypothetical protein [Rheinheimera soli]
MNLRKIIKILALVPMTAFALQLSPVSEIKALQSYTNWGNADVVVVLQSTSGVCKGYWFNKDDAGYQSNLSMLIAAYQANTKLQLHGHEEISSKWAGSATHFCKLYSVTYSR